MSHNWSASFIAAPQVARPDPEEAKQPLPAVYARKEFQVGGGLVAATVSFTAIGLIELWLNGQRVGDELLVPGWTEYADRVRVSTFDVTAQLVLGANALGAILGEGWAVGSMGFTRVNHVWNDRALGFVQLELQYSDRTEVIGSDDSWRLGGGAIVFDSIYDGETYDARLYPHGWDRPGLGALHPRCAGRHHDRAAPHRGDDPWRARLRAEPHGTHHRHLHPCRRRSRHVGTPADVPRLPLRRHRWLAG